MANKKCNFKLCKVKMDLVNCMECKKCHNKFCLDHRLFEAHNCEVFKNEHKINELEILRNKMTIQNDIIKSLKNLIK
jgi:hypothetical protein